MTTYVRTMSVMNKDSVSPSCVKSVSKQRLGRTLPVKKTSAIQQRDSVKHIQSPTVLLNVPLTMTAMTTMPVLKINVRLAARGLSTFHIALILHLTVMTRMPVHRIAVNQVKMHECPAVNMQQIPVTTKTHAPQTAAIHPLDAHTTLSAVMTATAVP